MDDEYWKTLFDKHFKDDDESNVLRLNLLEPFKWKYICKHCIWRRLNTICTEYNVASDYIIRCYKNKGKTLVLKNQNLVMIPTLISCLSTLTRLSLIELDVKELNLEIKQLKSLKHFTVDRCNLTELPSWLSEFKELTTISIIRCYIEQIPAFRFPKLKAIDFSFNKISNFAVDCLESPFLSKVNLQGNPLKINWNSNLLNYCVYLNISCTHIERLPKKISSKLTVLSWHTCNVEALPSKFSENLAYLDVSNNNLSTIPLSLTSSPALEYLNLSGNSKLRFSAQLLNKFQHIPILIVG